MSINWFTYTTYLKYKNECLDEKCENLKITEKNKNGEKKMEHNVTGLITRTI